MRLDHLLSMENVRTSKRFSKVFIIENPTVRVRVYARLLFNFQGLIEDQSEYTHGGVAQLGEHLPCKQGVMGSNPIISTSR